MRFLKAERVKEIRAAQRELDALEGHIVFESTRKYRERMAANHTKRAEYFQSAINILNIRKAK